MKAQAFAILVAALAATATAHAAGNPIQTGRITVGVEWPLFLPSTPECAAGRAHTTLVTESGAVIGSSMFRIASAPFDSETSILIESGTLTFYLPGGAVFADTTIVDQLTDYPFKQSIAGTVIGGSGIYAGASGTVGGSGTIVFDDKGNFDPDTTIEIDLA
jgi:hypothetical protein